MPGPAGPFIRFDLTYEVEGYPCHSYHYYSLGSGSTSQSATQDACDNWHGAMFTLFQAVLSMEVIIFGTTAVANDGTDQFTAYHDEPAGTNGGSGGDVLPGQDCAACVRHLLLSGGRIKRGHFYLSGLDEGKVEEGHITDDYRDDIQDLCDALLTANPGTPQVWSTSTAAWLTINSYSVTKGIRVLRRRRTNS